MTVPAIFAGLYNKENYSGIGELEGQSVRYTRCANKKARVCRSRRVPASMLWPNPSVWPFHQPFNRRKRELEVSDEKAVAQNLDRSLIGKNLPSVSGWSSDMEACHVQRLLIRVLVSQWTFNWCEAKEYSTHMSKVIFELTFWDVI
jgi:hypothetical protein